METGQSKMNVHPDVEAFAARLSGRQYREEITNAEAREAEAAGLVVVFGASDDLMEFRGAVYDEVDCYGGGLVRVDAKGIVRKLAADDLDEEELDLDELSAHIARYKCARTIKALWCEGSTGWCYETDIPHATFRIVEGAEYYCDGIVFRLADAAPTSSSSSSSSKPVGVGTAVERLDPTSLSHRMRGEVIEADDKRLTVRWSSGKQTKVARSAEGKRWRRAG